MLSQARLAEVFRGRKTATNLKPTERGKGVRMTNYNEASNSNAYIPYPPLSLLPKELIVSKDYKKGDKVLYIPNHANGDATHPDCMKGVVSSVNEKFVFVKYDNLMCTMTTGDEPYTAQATKRENLKCLSRR